MVVVDGADKLREGAKVELITRDAQAAPAAGAKGQRGNRPPGSGPPADGQPAQGRQLSARLRRATTR